MSVVLAPRPPERAPDASRSSLWLSGLCRRKPFAAVTLGRWSLRRAREDAGRREQAVARQLRVMGLA